MDKQNKSNTDTNKIFDKHNITKIYFLLFGIGSCVLACIIGYSLGKNKLYKNIPSGYEPTPIKNICIRENIIDVGEVSRGQLVKSSFELLNIGKEPLTIKEVKTSCGCTTADLSKRIVFPGKNLIVPLTINTSKINGNNFQKALRVGFEEINDDPNKSIVFQIKGLIDLTGKVLAWPNVLDFGNMVPGQQSKQKVYFRASNQLTENLPNTIFIDELKEKILNIKTSRENTKSDTKTIDITLKIPDSAIYGELDSMLSVVFQTIPSRIATFQIKANITPGFFIKPTSLYLSVTSTGQSNTADIKIEYVNSKQPIEIREISSELPIKWELIDCDTEGMRIIRVKTVENIELTSVKNGKLTMRFGNNFLQDIKVVLVPIESPSGNSKTMKRN